MKKLSLILSIALTALIPAFSAPSNEAVMTGTQNQTVAGQKAFSGALVVGGSSRLAWADYQPPSLAPDPLIAAIASGVSITAKAGENGMMLYSGGLGGIPLVSVSETGSPAGKFIQRSYFSSPALSVVRAHTVGEAASSSPVLEVLAGTEAVPGAPLARFAHCLALSGDDGFIIGYDASLRTTGTDSRLPSQILLGNDSILTRGLADARYVQTGSAVPWTEVGNTVAPLVNGLIPAANLPSYVDDVLEFANLAAFPAPGETGKIYVAKDSERIFRWSGTAYIEIVPSPGSTDAISEGESNLYFTNARAISALTSTLTNYVTTSDPRLTLDRTPYAHKSTHAVGGSDALTPSDIGAGATGQSIFAAPTLASARAVFKRAQLVATGTESRMSVISVTNDEELSGIALDANGVYRIEYCLFYNAPASGGIKLYFYWPTTSNGIAILGGLLTQYLSATPSIMQVPASSTNTSPFNNPNSANFGNISGHFYLPVGASGGNFDIRWAQNTSNSTPSKRLPGSFIIIEKLN